MDFKFSYKVSLVLNQFKNIYGSFAFIYALECLIARFNIGNTRMKIGTKL